MGRLSHPSSPQTFIRNAAAKALVDSPALNSLSRQVLVPLSRAMPSATINIPGPGPPEPRDSSVSPLPPAKNSDALPAGPGSSTELIDPTSSGDGETHDTHDNGDDDEEAASPPPVAGDPYANLDNAFGGYLADEPRPQTDNQLAGLF